jgi:hypothetical protein
MKTTTKLSLFVAAILLSVTAAFAQDWLRADHKINGGRVRSNQRHAQDQATALYALGQIQRPIPKEELMEYIAAIKSDLAASDKALAKLEAEYKKNKDSSELADSIKKHHARCTEQCTMAEKTYTKAEGDKVVVGTCGTEIYYELEAAQAESQKLLAMLKIDNIEIPKKPVTRK